MAAKLDRLRVLTNQVQNSFPSGSVPNVITWKGGCCGTGLYKTDDIAVVHAYLPKGAILDWHVHEASVECIFVYRGSCVFELKDHGIHKIGRGERLIIPVGISHRVIDTPKECEMIGLTHPADEAYPDGDGHSK